MQGKYFEEPLAREPFNDYLTRTEIISKECLVMWMTREEIAAFLNIVPNSVRGKVQKGQIERKIEGGKNLYQLVDGAVDDALAPAPSPVHQAPPPPAPTPPVEETPVQEIKKAAADRPTPFNPKQVLLDQLASMNVGRSIEAIEKGDEIDLATGEISRELDARISMRKHKQIKEIEEALERIKHGEYGTCEDCGEPIPEQRLRLFPAAKLCVRCQEEFDQYEKLKEDQALRGGAWRDDTTDAGYVRSFED
jgi:DnaK suppressor protein